MLIGFTKSQRICYFVYFKNIAMVGIVYGCFEFGVSLENKTRLYIVYKELVFNIE